MINRFVSIIEKNIHYYFIISAYQSTDILEDCHKLLERFNYPWEMMPLMCAILKYARGDLEEASQRIDEGKMKTIQHSFTCIFQEDFSIQKVINKIDFRIFFNIALIILI